MLGQIRRPITPEINAICDGILLGMSILFILISFWIAQRKAIDLKRQRKKHEQKRRRT